MAITDELRKWAQICGIKYDSKLYEIADTIDAAHRSALEKLAAQLDETSDMREFCERLDRAANSREDVTIWGVDYTPLPVDADGVPIHVGDLLTDTERQSIGLKPTAVKCILYNDEGCVVSANDPHGYWYDPSLLRHHRTQTVEDVLREMLTGMGVDASEHCADAASYIAEFAARLRLAEGVDQ